MCDQNYRFDVTRSDKCKPLGLLNQIKSDVMM